MGKIRVLPSSVINKVNAGEVIDGIPSIVKELVDNSLDANAKNIQIFLTDEGTREIKVLDDGEGMEEDDLVVCALRHFTSKISDYNDLLSLNTFGFRGEALSSIAQVADLTLKSKTQGQDLGNLVRVVAGEVVEIQACGMHTGTLVEVTSLFANEPVKKHFNESKGHNLAKVINVVHDAALIHPNVRFVLYNDSSKVSDTYLRRDAVSRLELVFGAGFLSNFVPVSFDSEYIKVSGHLVRPQHATKKRNHQLLYVNKRRIYDSRLSVVVENSYETLLEVRSFPQFFLHLEMPTDFFDVNFHPRKETVKFFNSTYIESVLQSAIQQTLQNNDLAYTNKSLFYLPRVKDSGDSVEAYRAAPSKEVLQIHNLYLLYETGQGLCVVDQHAAHERIIYQKLLSDYEEGLNTTSQKLKEPLLLTFTPAEKVLLEESLGALADLGFHMEATSENSYQVHSHPKPIPLQQIKQFLLDLVDDIKNQVKRSKPSNRTKLTLSYMACRSAIKGGEYLSSAQRAELIQQLEQTTGNYTCPHGRPTMINIELNDIHKFFKRM